MFQKILIANRGEIPPRIQRARPEMGTQSGIVPSEARPRDQTVKNGHRAGG